MYIVLLKFAENKALARQFMEAHNAWIKAGFDDGVFLLTGSLEGGQGGTVLAHGLARDALEERVAADPFVREGVVAAEIVQIAPAKADERLGFLLA